MTSTDTDAGTVAPSPPARHERLYLLARAEKWCETTGTPHTILAQAISGNPGLLMQLPGREITAETHARCMAGLDALAKLDAAAGAFVPPRRTGGRGDAAAAAKQALQARIDRVSEAIGLRAPLIALAVTHDSTLMSPRGGVSDAQFCAYEARLDRIEAAFTADTGDHNGEAIKEGGPAPAPPAGHRDEGRAVH